MIKFQKWKKKYFDKIHDSNIKSSKTPNLVSHILVTHVDQRAKKN